MNKPIYILFVSFSLLTSALQAQHNDGTTTTKGAQTQATSNSEVPAQFKAKLSAVFKSSQELKESLISSGVKKAQQAAGAVKKALSQVDMRLLTDKAHTAWMNYQNIMNSSLDKIEQEGKLKAQRTYFALFSEALFNSVKTFGVTGEPAYYQFCPMALEGEGAYWLSDSKQIRNPYLGDKMLTCGSTKETLK